MLWEISCLLGDSYCWAWSCSCLSFNKVYFSHLHKEDEDHPSRAKQFRVLWIQESVLLSLSVQNIRAVDPLQISYEQAAIATWLLVSQITQDFLYHTGEKLSMGIQYSGVIYNYFLVLIFITTVQQLHPLHMRLEKQTTEDNHSRIFGRKEEKIRLRRALVKDKEWIKLRLNKNSSK